MQNNAASDNRAEIVIETIDAPDWNSLPITLSTAQSARIMGMEEPVFRAYASKGRWPKRPDPSDARKTIYERETIRREWVAKFIASPTRRLSSRDDSETLSQQDSALFEIARQGMEQAGAVKHLLESMAHKVDLEVRLAEQLAAQTKALAEKSETLSQLKIAFSELQRTATFSDAEIARLTKENAQLKIELEKAKKRSWWDFTKR